MKELDECFKGKGQVKDFLFTRVMNNEYGYIYRVYADGRTHYEVFKRRENSMFNCVSYPTDKSFGVWAWTYRDVISASKKFYQLGGNNG